eukprot:s3376_g3.t1
MDVEIAFFCHDDHPDFFKYNSTMLDHNALWAWRNCDDKPWHRRSFPRSSVSPRDAVRKSIRSSVAPPHLHWRPEPPAEPPHIPVEPAVNLPAQTVPQGSPPVDGWRRTIWDLLQAEGLVDEDDEQPVLFASSYYIDHINHQRHEHARPLRFDSDFRDWENDVRLIWEDLVSPILPLDVTVLHPAPPISIAPGTAVTLIVHQRPHPERAVCLTTAIEIQHPRNNVIEVAHSLPRTIAPGDLIRHAGVEPLCQQRREQGHGDCTIRIGFQLQDMNMDIHFNHGQGFVISVPAPISAADIEHNLADRLRRQRLLRPRHTWEDPDPEEPEATHPRLQPPDAQNADHPEDATSFMARSHLAPTPSTAAASQDSSSEIGDTSSSGITGRDEWRLSRVFCLDGTTVDIDAPWDDADNLWNIVASNFNIPAADVIRVMHVGSRPADLQQADLECLLLQRRQDEPAVDFLRLVLIDVEYKADHRGAAMPLERKSKWIPRRTTRESLIRLLGYDGHCSQNPARCDLWINDEYIDVDAAILRLTNGDYVRAAVPSHPDDPECDQENLDTNQSMSSDTEFLHFLLEEDALLQTTSSTIPRMTQPRVALGDITNHPRLCKIDDHDEVHGRTYEEPLIPAPDVGRPELQLGEHFECLQQLQAIWTHYAAAELEEEGRVLYVSTWYSDSTRWPKCAASRPVRLLDNAALWIDHIAEAWDDRVDPDAVLHIYLLKPQPRQDLWDTGVQPHVLIVQNPTAGLRSVHFSLLDTLQVHAGLRQHVDVVSAQATKEHILQVLRLLEKCIPNSDVDCMVWWGDVELRGHEQLPVQDGYSIFVIYNQLQAEFGTSGASSSSAIPAVSRSSPADASPAEDDDESRPVSLLQVSARTTRQTVLLEQALDSAQSEQERQTGTAVAHAYRPCSDTAPAETTFAQLWSACADMQLPTYIEIPPDGSETHVIAELRHWGHQCKVIRFGEKSLYLCIPVLPEPAIPGHHYAYHHDDFGDPHGAILHTSSQPMTLQQHLVFLCDLGYDRAVLRFVSKPDSGFCCINFLQCNPSTSKSEPVLRQRTDWPERQTPVVPLAPVYHVEHDSPVSGPCQVRTPFDSSDLRQLFAAGKDFLCTDFSLFPLPDYVQQVMQPPDPSVEFDRWLIYTDGSSQSKMRHHTPEYVDANDCPDSWAMLVVGELYHNDGSSTVHPIGWTAHTVRYDVTGANFAGAGRIGAEVAEREGLFWAGLWRITQNCSMPTLFCVDSSTTGAQAFGNMGAHSPDLSYRLLRGAFQFLKIGLPHGHLGLHHVRAHAGDPYNEFVDLAAKREAQQSFNHPRMPLNMQSWQHKLPYLWLLFADRLGLPPWHEGLRVPPPDLPSVISTTSSTNSNSCPVEVIRGELSLATMNVLAISKAPDGHAGRLHFLSFEQVKSFGLNVVGIQEGRNPESLSNTHGIYRICAGDDRGQLGVELWVNLQQPVGYDAKGHPICLHPRCFQVTHKDPRRLVVRCDHDVLTGWFFVAHGPHSGTPATMRKEWWQQTEDLIHSFNDGSPWFWLIDANAAPGPADESVWFSKTTCHPAPTHRSSETALQLVIFVSHLRPLVIKEIETRGRLQMDKTISA